MSTCDVRKFLSCLNGVSFSEHEQERLLAVVQTVNGAISAAASQRLDFNETPWSFSTFLMQSKATSYQSE